MKEVFRGKDRTGKEFTVTTSTLDKEDRLHLIVNMKEPNSLLNADYTFFCNDTYNHQTKWNVTRCKAVLKAIENKKIELRKKKIKHYPIKKERFCAVGIQCIGGKEYTWNIPPKLNEKIKAGAWVMANTVYGKVLVQVVRVIPASEIDFKPTQSIEYITKFQGYKLFTSEEKYQRWLEKKAMKQANTEQESK